MQQVQIGAGDMQQREGGRNSRTCAVRFVGGGETMSFAAGVNAEQQQGKLSIGARIGINFTL